MTSTPGSGGPTAAPTPRRSDGREDPHVERPDTTRPRRRFSRAERLVHRTTAALMLLCVATAACLYVPQARRTRRPPPSGGDPAPVVRAAAARAVPRRARVPVLPRGSAAVEPLRAARQGVAAGGTAARLPAGVAAVGEVQRGPEGVRGLDRRSCPGHARHRPDDVVHLADTAGVADERHVRARLAVARGGTRARRAHRYGVRRPAGAPRHADRIGGEAVGGAGAPSVEEEE